MLSPTVSFFILHKTLPFSVYLLHNRPQTLHCIKQVKMVKAPAIVFGAAGVAAFSTEQLNEIFDILDKHNVKELDTARLYVSLPIDLQIDNDC